MCGYVCELGNEQSADSKNQQSKCSTFLYLFYAHWYKNVDFVDRIVLFLIIAI